MVHTVGTEINEYLKGAGERPGYMVKNYEICVPNRNNTICSVYYEGEWDKKIYLEKNDSSELGAGSLE